MNPNLGCECCVRACAADIQASYLLIRDRESTEYVIRAYVLGFIFRIFAKLQFL